MLSLKTVVASIILMAAMATAQYYGTGGYGLSNAWRSGYSGYGGGYPYGGGLGSAYSQYGGSYGAYPYGQGNFGGYSVAYPGGYGSYGGGFYRR